MFTFEGFERLTPEAKETYRRALLRHPLEPDTPGLEEALQLGLLVPDPFQESLYNPVDPGRAVSNLVGNAVGQLAAIGDFIGQLPTLRDTVTEVFCEVRAPGRSDYVEHLHGNELINARIEETINKADTELLTAQPGGPRTESQMARARGRDTYALERGVKMRTLYHSSARRSPFTQDWARLTAGSGAEIRTLDDTFLRIIIIDREYAFIQDLLPRAGGEPGNAWAHLIKDPATCAFLVEIFDRDWNRADSWYGDEAQVVPSGVTTKVQRSILRQLSSGRTQEQAAKSLGLSTRTLQKHLNALRAKIPQLHSVPQMTYWWATSPERALD